MYHEETSQLICSADHLSGFYFVHGIEMNFRTTCGFFAGLLCFYLIGSLLSVIVLYLIAILFLFRGVVNYSLSKMSVNLVQYRGTVGVFKNRKFFNRLQYKKMFEPTFFQMYLFTEYFYLPCNVVVPLFTLLASLIQLKPKVHNVATISASAIFCITCIHLRPVNWLYSSFLILLNGDVEINPGPRHNSGESFSICHWNLNSVSAYNYTKLSSL